MVKSMTGFGRSERVTDAYKIVVEMKSVNHRFCDINIKLPKKISFFETNIRTYLKKYIERGKVDVFITYEDFSDDNVKLKYNKDVAEKYMGYFEEMSKDFGIENSITPAQLGGFPDVFTVEEQAVDQDELWKIIETSLDEAAKMFVQSRITEGENLKKDMIDKLDGMRAAVDYIEEISPELVEEYRRKLTDKITEVLDNPVIDENREANTILSKANSLDVSDKAIQLKTDIEKVREQIQNLE